jgi:excinuclease ABC subunit B
MKKAIEETNRRRAVQKAYNEAHGITPRQVKSNILDLSAGLYDANADALPLAAEGSPEDLLSEKDIKRLIKEATDEMQKAADEMRFEEAAAARDRIVLLKDMDLGLKPPSRALLAAPVKQESTAGMAGRKKGGRGGSSPRARAKR